MAAIRSQIAAMPQPKIMVTAQHLPGNLNWVNVGQGACNPSSNDTSACTFNNAGVMNNYTDALARAGVQAIDINFDPIALSAASQYTGTLPNDCPSGWNCRTLANYDSMIAHAVAVGIKVRLRPKPDSVIAPCALGTTQTEANLESCLKPLYVAAAARWAASIDSITLIHEAVGGWGTVLPWLTVSIVHTFVNNTAAAVKAQQSTIKVGAAAETMFAADAPYFSDYVANPSLDYVGVDLYGSTWDVTQYPTTALATVATWAAAAAANHKEIRVEESARPRWLPSTAPTPGEQYAIEGAGDIDWLNDGVDAAWLDAVVPWAAAQGFSSFSTFPGCIFLWYTTDHANDNMQIGLFPKNLMSHLTGATATGVTYTRLSAWRATALQGNAHLSGRARIGH